MNRDSMLRSIRRAWPGELDEPHPCDGCLTLLLPDQVGGASLPARGKKDAKFYCRKCCEWSGNHGGVWPTPSP